jgi:hypothetical protein
MSCVEFDVIEIEVQGPQGPVFQMPRAPAFDAVTLQGSGPGLLTLVAGKPGTGDSATVKVDVDKTTGGVTLGTDSLTVDGGDAGTVVLNLGCLALTASDDATLQVRGVNEIDLEAPLYSSKEAQFSNLTLKGEFTNPGHPTDLGGAIRINLGRASTGGTQASGGWWGPNCYWKIDGDPLATNVNLYTPEGDCAGPDGLLLMLNSQDGGFGWYGQTAWFRNGISMDGYLSVDRTLSVNEWQGVTTYSFNPNVDAQVQVQHGDAIAKLVADRNNTDARLILNGSTMNCDDCGMVGWTAGEVDLTGGFSAQTVTATGLAATSWITTRSINFQPFTVATLPNGQAVGTICRASNGRNAGEAAGAGTGCLVIYQGGGWKRMSDNTAIQA